MDQPPTPRLSWLAIVGLVNAPLALWFFLSEQSVFLQGRMSRGQIPGRDFINFWTGAKLAAQGRVFDIFDQNAYTRALAGFWGPGLKVHSFSYPPSILPLILWLGALPTDRPWRCGACSASPPCSPPLGPIAAAR
jgi:hypothetical protein